MNAFFLFSVLSLSFLQVQAQQTPAPVQILDGSQPSKALSALQIASQIRPGQIIVMGENHGLVSSTRSQMDLLNALRSAGLSVSVALEFFSYPDQAQVDAYRLGQLSEADFLKQIGWGLPGFEFYRAQAQFPRLEASEKTLAINAPRTLTSAIAMRGLQGLTPAELALLPPNFQVGRDAYKKRFLAQMPHLPNPAAGENYFAAQSAWDDTMAWKAAEFIKAHPQQVLAIVVGDFHAQYGGGLPDRLLVRTQQTPLVFSFVNTNGLSSEEVRSAVEPSAEFGPRGDYIWLAADPG